MAFGVCTCTGGFYDNYATVQGIDTIIPVDIYIPGCPPRPENVIDGLIKLQEKIQKGEQSRTLYDPRTKIGRPEELQQGYTISQHIKNIE